MDDAMTKAINIVIQSARSVANTAREIQYPAMPETALVGRREIQSLVDALAILSIEETMVKCYYCKYKHEPIKSTGGQYLRCPACHQLFKQCGTCHKVLAHAARKCRHCGRPNV